MSRTRLISLVLVNWKGVFYERYLLDANVTALEGSNGAGKTTVMIAAYVALLPDMSRLRFTNLGESGGARGDRGIAGRLGEPGRPSYTVLELGLPGGTRMIAGVRLQAKGRSTVEPTPFLIEHLSSTTTLQDLLLVSDGEQELVPELAELRALAKNKAATMTVFRSAKEYFAALFERGVSPLRLVGEEERDKYNDMLRTSMTGGISKTLTTELRSFVLKKESGLADTLSRMRSNLDTCRRSRSEVADARRLQCEISGVYDAGAAFFSHMVRATQTERSEHRDTLSRCEKELATASRDHANLTLTVTQQETRQEEVQALLGRARERLQKAKEIEERRARAQIVARELSERDDELSELATVVECTEGGMKRAEQERCALQQRLVVAQDTYDRAALGLAKLQDGLDELHRRARDYRHVHQSVERARGLLNRETLPPEECSDVLNTIINDCESIDLRRARQERDLQALALRRSEYKEASKALAYLETSGGLELDSEHSLHHRARVVLADFERRSACLLDLPEKEQERAEWVRLAKRQHEVWERATSLGLEVGKVGAASDLATRLEIAESACLELDEKLRRYHSLRVESAGEQERLQAEQDGLDLRIARFQKAADIVRRLEEHVGVPDPLSESALETLDRALADEHALLVTHRSQCTAQREDELQRAQELERDGGFTSSELLRIRDELNGELVAGCFEELSMDQAGPLEARLGPVAQAILVDDVTAATEILRDPKTKLTETVWLIQAGAGLETLRSNDLLTDCGRCVVVQERQGVRITPVPAIPTLGRSARGRAAARCRARASGIGEELERSLEELRGLDVLRRDVAVLSDLRSVYAEGDPESACCKLKKRMDLRNERSADYREQECTVREQVAGLRVEIDSLRRLLSDAALLELPNYQQQIVALDHDVAQIRGMQELLAAAETSRTTLAERMDVLRDEPPSEVEATKMRAEIEVCAEQRDRLWKARGELEEVLANFHALDWGDADVSIRERNHLVPALEEQHKAARTTVHELVSAAAVAEAAWTSATKTWQAADARWTALQAMRDRLAGELAEMHQAGTSEEHDENLVASIENQLGTLNEELLALVESCARDRERLRRKQEQMTIAAAALHHQQAVCEPLEKSWLNLEKRCLELGVSASLRNATEGESDVKGSSLQLFAEARGRLDRLRDRLHVTGGEGLEQRIVELSQPGGQESGRGPAWQALSVWSELLDWVRGRVPVQLAEECDPLLALEHLREHLGALEARLGSQERELRGSSEDVARGIEVQIRRAGWQVRRLNEHLDNVSFGSICGIRVQMCRVERMEQILRALREGQVQELLFQASLPFEEALNEIFSRYGGGRNGGQRLLDYREYLQLVVEVRRQSKAEWEEASPTKLSTGEAIGVGAALMMVVLTEWERDANLLRDQKMAGSLRFLFLDEANRLSKDNLGVLFELCRNLELQLLIAAPEVAHAGDNTTYRLVRRVGSNGDEEVLVSGRRAIA